MCIYEDVKLNSFEYRFGLHMNWGQIKICYNLSAIRCCFKILPNDILVKVQTIHYY